MEFAAYADHVATVATVLAACITAANLGSRITGYGFCVFLVGSIAWSAYAGYRGETGLLWTNLILCGINLLGIWRWLGRQARFDDGAKAASEASKAAPTPTLFPVSLLAGAPVKDEAGETVASTVDAMASCEDGRLVYAVVREGGVAGVGERLHKLPWRNALARTDHLVAKLGGRPLSELEAIQPDDWTRSADAK